MHALHIGIRVRVRISKVSFSEGVDKKVRLQVGDAPKPVLGDSLNMQIPWCGDARPASQVGDNPISPTSAWTRFFTC